VLAYLSVCLACRTRRLSHFLRDFKTGLPILGQSAAQARIEDSLQRLLKVDALIKDGCERVGKQAPQNIPARSPWMSTDALAAAITRCLAEQLKELSLAGIDATLYATMVVANVDLKQLWHGAAAYLKENPEAMMKLGIDTTKMLIEISPEHAEKLFTHLHKSLEYAAQTGGADAAESIDSIDSIDASGGAIELDFGPIPVFTALLSAFRGWRAVSRGYATVVDAFKSFAWDIGGTGVGAIVGGNVGTLFCPPFGTIFGAIIGAIAGRGLTNKFKYEALNTAKEQYESELQSVNAERHEFVCATYDVYAIMSGGMHAQYAVQYLAGFSSASGTATLDATVGELVATLLADCTSARGDIERRAEQVLTSYTDRWYHFLFCCGIRGALPSRLTRCVLQESSKIADIERRLSSAQTPTALLHTISTCAAPPNQNFLRGISVFEKALSEYLIRHIADFRCWIYNASTARAASISEMAKYMKDRAVEFENLASKLQSRLKPYEETVWREARRQGLFK
jgi:hypothetical protein